MTAIVLLAALAANGVQSQFEPGATLRVYDVGIEMAEMPELVAGQTPNIDKKIGSIDIKQGEFGLTERFYAVVQCHLVLKEPQTARFRLTSDDGSMLYVNGKLAINHGGVHAATAKEATVRLNTGRNSIKIEFFENSGEESLKLEIAVADQPFQVLSDSLIEVESGLTRVVAPGRKKIKGIGGARRPGNGMPLEKAHPSLEVLNIRPNTFQPQVSGMAALKDGSLLVATFSPNQSGVFLPDKRDGRLFKVTMPSVFPGKATVKELLVNLQEPLGLCVMPNEQGQERVFVCERNEVSEFIDRDKDGEFDGKRTVATGWKADNYHHFAFGPAARDGYLYISLATSITGGAPGANGPNPEYRGCILRIDPDHFDPAQPQANWEAISGGHRTPNGIAAGPFGLLLVGENQGSWQPSNKINVVGLGEFFGHYNDQTFKNKEYPNGGFVGPYDHQPLAAPALHLPHNECANSPSDMVVVPKGPFANHLLISDVKYGGLRRAWLEKVNGKWQGGVVQYSHGFECGTNRLAWLPNGWMAIGGIGATETWAWTDPKTGKWTTFGLQVARPTNKSAFEIHSTQTVENGFIVRFTEPLASKPSVDQVYLSQWNYEPTVEYGGPKTNSEKLRATQIVAVDPSKTRFKVVVPNIKTGRVVYANFDVKSAKGTQLWASEVWMTVNEKPKSASIPKLTGPRTLIFTRTTGYRHDSIEFGRNALASEIRKRGGTATITEDSAVFTSENLRNFDVVVFLSTTGDVLNSDQEKAFESFIRMGGGFAGIHAAADTEYQWAFFGECVGGYFKSHPAIQQARVNPTDLKHPSTRFLPKYWDRVDEWYDYRVNPRSKVNVLATVDESTYKGGTMGADHPIAWCRTIGQGRTWYTGGGHTEGSYREALFMEHVVQGVLWAAAKPGQP